MLKVGEVLPVTECTQEAFEFPACKRRVVEANFEGGDITTDGGVLLLRQADRLLGGFEIIDRLADIEIGQMGLGFGFYDQTFKTYKVGHILLIQWPAFVKDRQNDFALKRDVTCLELTGQRFSSLHQMRRASWWTPKRFP